MSLANLLKKGSLRGFATATPATLGGVSGRRSVAGVAVAAVKIITADPLDAVLNSGSTVQRLKAQDAL